MIEILPELTVMAFAVLVIAAIYTKAGYDDRRSRSE